MTTLCLADYSERTGKNMAIATHEDSDGTGYCRGCGTTIGEAHHTDCDLFEANRVKADKAGWISAAERLPDPGTDVLIWIDDPDDPWCAMGYHTARGEWKLVHVHDITVRVAFWMPLPEPPAICNTATRSELAVAGGAGK